MNDSTIVDLHEQHTMAAGECKQIEKLIPYEERINWFKSCKFGIFVHYGLYSILGRGEWVMDVERIPVEEYALLADQFTAEKLNVQEWVDLAKEAGAKYMVFTARHHDGFCLFDSKVSEFTSVKTAAKRDIVAEFVDACHRSDMKVGIYYSWLDWRFSGYYDRQKNPESFKDMVRQAREQIMELMSNYGRIDLLWYDGGWFPDVMPYSEEGAKEVERLWNSKEVNVMVRQLQPHILISNRSGDSGDFDTPEQKIEASKNGRPWETSMTIGDYWWGYVKNYTNMKTTVQLIQNLVKTAAEGGTFILNIGPKADGTVQEEFRSRLKEIGNWVTINKDSLYDTQECPFGGEMTGVTMMKDHNAYLHVLRWPGEELCVPNVAPEILSAYILKTGQPVGISYRSNARLILSNLPEKPPDPNDTVIVLEFKDKPRSAGLERGACVLNAIMNY